LHSIKARALLEKPDFQKGSYKVSMLGILPLYAYNFVRYFFGQLVEN